MGKGKLEFWIRGIIAAVLGLSCLGAAAFAEGSKELCDKSGIPEKLYVSSGVPYSSANTADLKAQNQAYRPYLEWKNGLQFGLPRRTVIYAYANKGETIYFGSSVKATSNKSPLRAVLFPEDKTGVDWLGTSVETTLTNYAGATVAVTLPVNESATEAYVPDNLSALNLITGGTGELTDAKAVYFFKPTADNIGVIENPTQEQSGANIGEKTDGYKPFSFVAPYDGVYSFRFLSTQYQNADPGKVVDVDGA